MVQLVHDVYSMKDFNLAVFQFHYGSISSGILT